MSEDWGGRKVEETKLTTREYPRPELGVLINELSGARNSGPVKKSIGKVVKSFEIVDEYELIIEFTDGSKISIWDDGQSCCEKRYMRSDDDIDYFAGGKLIKVELSDSIIERRVAWGVVESQFLKITTTKGTFTVVNYNDHNGFYGGFYLNSKEIK